MSACLHLLDKFHLYFMLILYTSVCIKHKFKFCALVAQESRFATAHRLRTSTVRREADFLRSAYLKLCKEFAHSNLCNIVDKADTLILNITVSVSFFFDGSCKAIAIDRLNCACLFILCDININCCYICFM